ncbi:hypothetical protein [Rhodanobacter sp. C05]|uniref:hypothetical protein n=1 Tax=Rhodanobacter sp. C05 TaxID=1945855 RepID=UPI00117A3290|nr:hypothetical protein [Rhodanobacter sp. C05]
MNGQERHCILGATPHFWGLLSVRPKFGGTVKSYIFGVLLMLTAASCKANGIDFSSVSCGTFEAKVSKTAYSDTPQVQGMMIWLMGYSAGKNGISTLESSDAKPFFDELRTQCTTNQSQLLLPLVERLGKTMLHTTPQPVPSGGA